jgi:hypothetical protein
MNGTAALKLVAPAPAPQTPIEAKIGAAMAAATAAVCRGCFEWGWCGGLTAEAKEAGASKIADLYWLFQEAPGPDFFVIARSEGRRVLMERLGADAHEPTVDVIVDGVLEILGRVSNFMRATAS